MLFINCIVYSTTITTNPCFSDFIIWISSITVYVILDITISFKLYKNINSKSKRSVILR